jgi:hypothetical protein
MSFNNILKNSNFDFSFLKTNKREKKKLRRSQKKIRKNRRKERMGLKKIVTL